MAIALPARSTTTRGAWTAPAPVYRQRRAAWPVLDAPVAHPPGHLASARLPLTHVTPARLEPIIASTTEELLHRRGTLAAHDLERDALRDRVIAIHLSMAFRLARRYVNRGELYDDLAQVAALALVKAVDAYDPDRGTRFVSYAIPSILGALKRHFRDTTWGLRVSRDAQELIILLRTGSGDLAHRLARAPTSAELAEYLGVGLDRILATEAAAHAYRPESLDRVDGDGVTLGWMIGSTDARYAAIDDQLLVRDLLAALPERDRQIVTMRFYDEMTQSQIAALIGVSQMHVSRLLRQSLSRLQKAMSTPPVMPAPVNETCP